MKLILSTWYFKHIIVHQIPLPMLYNMTMFRKVERITIFQVMQKFAILKFRAKIAFFNHFCKIADHKLDNNFLPLHFEHMMFLSFLFSLKFRFQRYITCPCLWKFINTHFSGVAKIRHYGFWPVADKKAMPHRVFLLESYF